MPTEPTPTDPEDDLLRCTIYTRRADAAEAYAAGLATNLQTVNAAIAAGLLAGGLTEGATGHDVARQLAAYAITWLESGDLTAYRIAGDEPDGDCERHIIWTCLNPANGWTKMEDAVDWAAGEAWTVLGGGLASSEASAIALAAHAWAYQLDLDDMSKMPTVIIDRDAAVDAHIAAAAARKRGIAVETVDRAYGILRAAGASITWETLLGCAAGIQWGSSPAFPGPAEGDL